MRCIDSDVECVAGNVEIHPAADVIVFSVGHHLFEQSLGLGRVATTPVLLRRRQAEGGGFVGLEALGVGFHRDERFLGGRSGKTADKIHAHQPQAQRIADFLGNVREQFQALAPDP